MIMSRPPVGVHAPAARTPAGNCAAAVRSAVVCDEGVYAPAAQTTKGVFATLTGRSGEVRVRDEVRAD
ncbi:MAG: hypothetical protein AAB152_02760 [Candidatus Coatesbacteria bacterium]